MGTNCITPRARCGVFFCRNRTDLVCVHELCSQKSRRRLRGAACHPEERIFLSSRRAQRRRISFHFVILSGHGAAVRAEGSPKALRKKEKIAKIPIFSQKLTCYNAIFVIKYIHQSADGRHNGRSAARGAFYGRLGRLFTGAYSFSFSRRLLQKRTGRG